MKSDTAPTTVNCPSCGKKVAWTLVEVFRPFCSERCKLIDLGEWATEGYAIADTSASLEEETDEFASDSFERSQLFE
ncbi:MAG TPA: DNA gyrase inhibitor YacG [Methylococcaceae bacterium]|jgi:endogenous inhibitor of DNA gyrase (YacG/DUF329 family)|nr:DNA gyrase inhibitor YacG [Methylococcaceae bacterium]